MDTIFVKKYVAKGELPTANGWYTIKFSNSDKQRIEQLRFDVSKKKFHDDDSDFDHVEYWLDEMTLSQYLSSIIPAGEITTTHFSHILFSESQYKVRDCFALAEQMTAKALEKRDLEWWENCILNDAVAPNPQAGKNWLATSSSYHEKLIRETQPNSGWILGEGFVKKVLGRYTKEEISFGKMVELFNEQVQSSAGGFSLEYIHNAINMARGITIKGDGTHFFHSTNSEIINYLQSLPQPALSTKEELARSADEREVLVQAFDKVQKEFEGRSWIMEGRGCYPYNDDRYKEEVRYIFDAFKEIKKEVWGNIKSKSFEYRDRIKAETIAQLSEKWNNENMKVELVKFGKWYQLDEMQREHKELWTSIVDRYLIKRARFNNY